METEEIPALPALRSLGKLADVRPTIVIDTREQEPLPFERLPTVRAGLRAGDYSFLGGEEYFAVERKSIADLVSCCVNSNRERFEWELHRLRGFHFRRLLVVGAREDIEQGLYRSNITPKAVLATLSAFEVRHGIPVVFLPAPAPAGRQIESWAYWCAREIVVQANTLLRGSLPPSPQEQLQSC